MNVPTATLVGSELQVIQEKLNKSATRGGTLPGQSTIQAFGMRFIHRTTMETCSHKLRVLRSYNVCTVCIKKKYVILNAALTLLFKVIMSI